MEFPETTGVFLDFDGVILDTVSIKTRAFEKLFKDYDVQIIQQVMQYHLLHGGISRVEKIRHAHEHFIGVPLAEVELAGWSRNFSSLVVEEVVAAEWIAGAREFLEEMQGGVPLFVVSGTPEPELREVIARRGMTHYFTEICGSPVKKPAHVERIIAQYQLLVENSFFVGDALTDHDAARLTGTRFIGIRGEVELPSGTLVLDDCRDLRKTMLEGMNPGPRE
jgi:phosphoglycolate phosphatase-like HAD superfamily hydrolase